LTATPQSTAITSLATVTSPVPTSTSTSANWAANGARPITIASWPGESGEGRWQIEYGVTPQ